MNILIKLTCLVGLVIAPILGEMYSEEGDNHHVQNTSTEIQLEEVQEEMITEVK